METCNAKETDEYKMMKFSLQVLAFMLFIIGVVAFVAYKSGALDLLFG